MQDGAIFMQRMEFLLKAYTSLSIFWWQGKITGETARIPKAKLSVSNIYFYDHGLTGFLQWHNSCWVVGEYKFLSWCTQVWRGTNSSFSFAVQSYIPWKDSQIIFWAIVNKSEWSWYFASLRKKNKHFLLMVTVITLSCCINK